MLKHKDHFHGSDLELIEKTYGIKASDITSFSANVNPLGISPLLRNTIASHIDAISTYPDREYTALRSEIARYTETDINNIIVGNGSTELISLMIKIKAPKKAIIIGPTYSEYEREINLGQGSCRYYPLKEEDGFGLDIADLAKYLTEDVDFLVMCNPNNPTSTIVPRKSVRKLLDICKQKDIFLMIDETYIEFAKDYRKITCVPLTTYYNNLVILRGVSKYFAAPGLRLGYAVCGNPDLIKEIEKKKNPWTINTLASIAGEIMFRDKEYIDETYRLIDSERKRVTGLLSQIPGIRYYEPGANFVLVKILKDDITSEDMFETAIRKGLMIRDCSTFYFLDNHYFRFCFMTPEKDDELIEVIRQVMTGKSTGNTADGATGNSKGGSL